MKKIFSILIIVILLLETFAYARDSSNIGFINYFIDDGSTVFSKISRDGAIKNKAPVSTGNYPSNHQVASGNLVEFSWNYFDEEGDDQLNYQIELDDDSRFVNPFTYFGVGNTKRKIYILDGNKVYYWRVKSRDNFGWGDFSQTETFYLDLTRKVCEDGTSYYQCSVTDFLYCDNGELVDNCQLCGCGLNKECTLSGVCIDKTCFDGTKYGGCSVKRPNYCQNGDLKEACSICGCPDGQDCNSDGTCNKIIVKEGFKERVNIKETGFLGKFFFFVQNIFAK